MKLIIVESPTKARTIGKFLGKEYEVQSSYGHIRDLPKSKIGVDVLRNFEPQYVIPQKSRKTVTALKKKAAEAGAVILATDEDREGEAIAWHLTEALGLGNSKSEIQNSKSPPVERIVFHEITENAISRALREPRNINMNMVDAQQGRRILDRLVGYLLSPFLWKKVVRGLSAGRVQSAALKLIVEREEEIKKFKPEEYYTISALLRKLKISNSIRQPADKIPNEVEAELCKINNEPIAKLGIKTKEEAEKIAADLNESSFKAVKIEKKEIKKNPLPPFTTSTLQQEAFKRLRFGSRQTMRLAQGLYENGFITYMRTDSVNLSQESLAAAKNWIEKNLGENYLIPSPRTFKTKSRLAQEAHEAVRPTQAGLIPEDIKTENKQEQKLYELIWRRFIASQLPQAVFDATNVEIDAESEKLKTKNYQLKVTGNILRFDGFLKIWPAKFGEKVLPALKEGEELTLLKVNPLQHFTEPPPRYNEASLIKTLEEYGIGRPSTYAPIISVIQDRNYVQKNQDRRFEPTEIGTLVNRVLTEHFPEIVDIQFTARMEEDLDKIAGGKVEWQEVIKEFYEPFSAQLQKKYEEVSRKEFIRDEKTDETCDKCGQPMVIKTGRFGKFLACSGFPACKNTKSLNISLNGEKKTLGICPKCGKGDVVMKRTRTRRFFYGCNKYPDCDYASWKKPEGLKNESEPE